MKTAIIHDPLFAKHDTGITHPESSLRYSVVMEALRGDAELWGELEEVGAIDAKKGTILAAHTKEHFERVRDAFGHGFESLDEDTLISMRSFDAAIRAAGGVCSAVDAVLNGQARNAFVAARPPGHHATAETAQGFCLFNNVAIGAKYAQNQSKEIERVAIIDWDVHHGNGTQGIFFDEPSVFFFSMHQYPWYPGTGSKGEMGYGRGRGYTKNVPVKAHTKSSDQKHMFEGAIEDIRKKFTPDIIFVSAGFDSHLSDPLGQLELRDSDFQSMTKTLLEWADESCNGRIVSVLEGGYNLEKVGETVRSHVATLNEHE